MFDKAMNKINKVEADLKMWIGGVPKGTKWKELETHIEESCGIKPKVTEVMGKSAAVCTFDTSDEVAAAISTLTGTEFNGSTLEADVWTVKEKKEK